MDPLSRFYERCAPRFTAGPQTLYINPPCPLPRACTETSPAPALFTQDFAGLAQHRAHAVQFGCFPTAYDARPEDVVLRLPREKALLDCWLQWCVDLPGQDHRLWLLGENTSGIKSAGKQLERHYRSVRRVDAARHCGLWLARQPLQRRAFDPEACWSAWRMEAAGQHFEIHSLPGVFAHGHLDPGTALLLQALEEQDAPRRFLDFGCGCGVISAWLLLRHGSAEATLVDSNALALESSRRTLSRNGLAATILASNGLSEVRGTFDLVVSNPPFHEGAAERTGLTARLLEGVGNFLNVGGLLMLVANRHLPYAQWLDRAFGSHEIVGEDGRYRVYRAVRA